MAKKKKKPKLPKPRSSLIPDMMSRGATNGGRMRHRNDRRPFDKRRDETRNIPSSTEET